MSNSRKPPRTQLAKQQANAADKQSLLAAIDCDIDALNAGRSVGRDTAERHALLQRHHAAVASLYPCMADVPPTLPADLPESIQYLNVLRRFLNPSDSWDAQQDALAKNAQWAYQHYYPANGLELRFDLARIADVAKQLADVLCKRCPMVGHTFPFDRHDGRALREVGNVAYALRTLLDFSGAMPHKMAFQINALDGYGHEQRAAVVPLFQLWNALHDGVLKQLTEAKAESNYALPNTERQTIDALKAAAAELVAIVNATDQEPPATGGKEQGEGGAGKKEKRKRRQRGRKRGEYDEARNQKIYAAYLVLAKDKMSNVSRADACDAVADRFGLSADDVRLIVKRHRVRENRSKKPK